jgi:antitoxin ParD1/3/4
MATMNISLSDALKAFVDEQVAERGFGTSSEYVRDLLRRERDRAQLRDRLLQAAASGPSEPLPADYFDRLREQVRAGVLPPAIG